MVILGIKACFPESKRTAMSLVEDIPLQLFHLFNMTSLAFGRPLSILPKELHVVPSRRLAHLVQGVIFHHQDLNMNDRLQNRIALPRTPPHHPRSLDAYLD